MVPNFPAEPVPDGHIAAPHHYYIGFFACVLVLALVWDNYRHREPTLVAVGLVVGLFSFRFVWPFYPVVGALGALAGPLVALVVLLLGAFGVPVSPWEAYALRWRVLAVVFLLVTLDDAAEHAFGVPTPLDWVFEVYIAPHIATL